MTRCTLKVLTAGFLLLAAYWSLATNVGWIRHAHADRGRAANLRQIGYAMLQHASTHNGWFPDSLTTLARTAELSSGMFVCMLTEDFETDAAAPTTH